VVRLEEEFFRQGDEEKKLGLPVSALFDREQPGITKSQVRRTAEAICSTRWLQSWSGAATMRSLAETDARGVASGRCFLRARRNFTHQHVKGGHIETWPATGVVARRCCMLI
jgi:hypothetical protein